jgi:ATP synthase protein I
LPIFMIIFTLLGFVAGIRTMLSTAKEVQRDQASRLSEKNERDI